MATRRFMQCEGPEKQARQPMQDLSGRLSVGEALKLPGSIGECGARSGDVLIIGGGLYRFRGRKWRHSWFLLQRLSGREDALVPAAACAGANPGAGGQFAAQPGELDFADLDPAAAAGRLAALLEGQAFAVGIEAGIGVVARALE
ncbi:protein of unknown function [Pseudomonas inefficax]|uniref:Uncharacterized protein n=1 Tax=Pseudomonas inefficax TaxID=2078786 RepID=A0AAQ1SSA1_9PSED|nr:protein of unknown function [Pseudomonas inefficax]